jgi:uncharacterized Zn-binding protein involved in type VI secretion
MGKPAARLGDMTAHGGTIVLGLPTVLIGSMPAARVSDMHVCPMVTVLVPHVGGPILPPGSPTVLIGNMPAARMGDMATCVGPPDVIVLGCFTVLIGMAGGGGGAYSGAGGGAGPGGSTTPGTASVDAIFSAGVAIIQGEGPGLISGESHWIRFKFVDKTGKFISGVPYKFANPNSTESEGRLNVDGQVYWAGSTAGQGTVTLMDLSNARWSTQQANVGDEVTLTADVEGYPTGTDATFDIYKRDVTGADRFITSITAQTQGNTVETNWTYEYPEPREVNESGNEERRGYSSVKFYFLVRIRSLYTRSDLLEYRDWIELELTNSAHQPIADKQYLLYLPSGQVRRGSLDGNGFKREEDVTPGRCGVRFPDTPNVTPA